MSQYADQLLAQLAEGSSLTLQLAKALQAELEKTTQPTLEGDLELLREALKLLEYVTYHDGRYRQESNLDWQDQAQPLVTRLAARLGVKAYDGYGG